MQHITNFGHKILFQFVSVLIQIYKKSYCLTISVGECVSKMVIFCVKVFVCDGQNTVKQAILYVGRLCFVSTVEDLNESSINNFIKLMMFWTF